MPVFQKIKEFLALDKSTDRDAAFSELQKSRANTLVEKAEIVKLALELEAKQLAKTLTPDECVVLGLCYQHGDAVALDYNKAWICYESSNEKYSFVLRGEIFNLRTPAVSQNLSSASSTSSSVSLAPKIYNVNDLASAVSVKDLKKIEIILNQAVEHKNLYLVCRVWCRLEERFQSKDVSPIILTVLPALNNWIDLNVVMQDNVFDDWSYDIKEHFSEDLSPESQKMANILLLRIYYEKIKLNVYLQMTVNFCYLL